MTEKTMNPKAAKKQEPYFYVTSPDHHTPTDEERELYRMVMHSYYEFESWKTTLAFMTLEAEKWDSIDMVWIATLIYAAGKIHGIQQERERRKKGKKAEKENNR